MKQLTDEQEKVWKRLNEVRVPKKFSVSALQTLGRAIRSSAKATVGFQSIESLSDIEF